MLSHRMAGVALAGVGIAVLVGQLVMLYGSTGQQLLMVQIGLPGVVILSAAGAVCFSMGCLLAAAPRATTRHVRRAAALIQRAR